MTDAPERIWVEKSISEIGTHGSTAWPDEDKDCIEYTRADVSDALVAAAREETRAKTLAAVSSMLGDSSILALTTVEEEALLEKTLQKVREEALREADELAEAHGKLWSALAEIIESPGMSPNATVRRIAARAEKALVEDSIAEVRPVPRFYREGSDT